MLKRPRPELAPGCASDLTLDALRAGDLADAQRLEVEDHLRTCERCRTRHDAFAVQAVALQARLPAFDPAQARAQRAVESRRRFGLRPAVLASVAMAALALLVLIPRGLEQGTRTKGSPSLSFFVKRADQVFEGMPGQTVFPGDVLRFVLAPHGYTHAAVLSRSATGEASVYFPPSTYRASRAVAIAPGVTNVALDGAVELDQNIVDERVYGVFCMNDFDTSELQSELTAHRQIAPGPECVVVELALHKAVKP